MAKVYSEDGKYPKRIDDYIIYTLDGEKIMRRVSGFTSKGMQSDAKYALSRLNASEFGHLSQCCKLLRRALEEVLPKKNRLLVVNNFTKIMRQVQVCDTLNAKGNRSVVVGLQSEEGRAVLCGYNMHPFGNNSVGITRHDITIIVAMDSAVFPEGADCFGMRALVLEYDFETGNNTLTTGDWMFYAKPLLQKSYVMQLPDFVSGTGMVFRLAEVGFFSAVDGAFLGVGDGNSLVFLD